jgi:acyl carrier protein
MVIPSRTPEGFPSRCPLCGAETNLEFSDPAGDAPCPKCGHLLWLSGELLSWLRTRLTDTAGVPIDRVNADTALAELGTPSLDAVELVMEREEKFDVSIPEEVAERIETVGDAIRCIEQSRRGDSGNQ